MNAEEVKRLLPWYAAGVLDDEERRAVQSELGRSADLRRELAELRVLRETVCANDADVPEFRAALLEDALRRIDALEQSNAAAPAARKASVTVLGRVRSRIVNDWNTASGGARFALAAQLGLIFVLAGFLLMPASREPAGFTTASGGPQAGLPGGGAQFSVVFAPEASVEQISGFLDAQDLQIVSGPSTQGGYVVSAEERADRAATLEKLRSARELVRFAAPLAE